jgi:hypothetical protein
MGSILLLRMSGSGDIGCAGGCSGQRWWYRQVEFSCMPARIPLSGRAWKGAMGLPLSNRARAIAPAMNWMDQIFPDLNMTVWFCWLLLSVYSRHFYWLFCIVRKNDISSLWSMASLSFFCCNLFLGKAVNCMNAIYPCWKGAMSCYLEFLILERAVISLNVIYSCRKESHVVTVLLEQIAFAHLACIYLVCNVDNCSESKR